MFEPGPVLISISVDQLVLSANKRHHLLLCLPVCISAYAPTNNRHVYSLSFPVIEEKCSESDHRHIPDALYGVNDEPVEKRRERRCREDIGCRAAEVMMRHENTPSSLELRIYFVERRHSFRKHGYMCCNFIS